MKFVTKPSLEGFFCLKTKIALLELIYSFMKYIKSINEGFKLIISNNEYRENLIIAGLENAKKYSPQKIAAMYNQVYNTIENSL